MWKRKSTVTPKLGADIRILLPEAGLTTIFDECDQFDRDETGGRLVGSYTAHGAKLTIKVTGIIESGPQAKRSPVSFFQDGAYQEGIFRQIESKHPEIEHLGNWHTHHMNGYPTLSGGDIETYHRTVNHHNHNTPFFYALLVTAKNRTTDPRHRYSIKHFVFRRREQEFHEIPSRQVEIVQTPLVWPALDSPVGHSHRTQTAASAARPDRAYDNEVIREFYPGVHPFTSEKLGVYWRGVLELVDGSKAEVVVLEDTDAHKYSVALREAPAAVRGADEELAQAEFRSARAALMATERICNRVLHRRAQDEEPKFPR
jgi:hypothetical protein